MNKIYSYNLNLTQVLKLHVQHSFCYTAANRIFPLLELTIKAFKGDFLSFLGETSWSFKYTMGGIGREVGVGFRMGNTCKPMADSYQCMAKTTTIL